MANCWWKWWEENPLGKMGKTKKPKQVGGLEFKSLESFTTS